MVKTRDGIVIQFRIASFEGVRNILYPTLMKSCELWSGVRCVCVCIGICVCESCHKDEEEEENANRTCDKNT